MSTTLPAIEAIHRDLQERVSALDWEQGDADTRYLTHSVHRYSGKFIPQIARQAIDLLTKPGELILDPYCGSGTTLLESLVSGRISIGIDMNPVAVLLARTKCTPVAEPKLTELLRRLETAVANIREKPASDLLLTLAQDAQAHDQIKTDFRLREEWYLKWFDADGLYQLIGLHMAVMSIAEECLRNIALAAFSDILRRCSHAHGGYPNIMYDKTRRKRPEPAPLFRERLKEFCAAIATISAFLSAPNKPDVKEGDARECMLPSESVDAIITHPPYVGSIPYAEYGMLSLKWLGCDSSELDKRLTGGKRQSRDVLPRFEKDFGAMIRESYRVLKSGRHMFLMVGHPLVRGERINLSEMSCRLAEAAGFRLAAKISRTGVNRRANKMGDEDLLFFAK